MLGSWPTIVPPSPPCGNRLHAPVWCCISLAQQPTNLVVGHRLRAAAPARAEAVRLCIEHKASRGRAVGQGSGSTQRCGEAGWWSTARQIQFSHHSQYVAPTRGQQVRSGGRQQRDEARPEVGVVRQQLSCSSEGSGSSGDQRCRALCIHSGQKALEVQAA